MYELVQQRLPITKELIHTEEAVALFHRYGMFDKERLFRYRRSSHVNLYAMNEFRDYYYGYMMPDTGDLKYFALYLYQGGIVLQMPLKDEPEKVPLFVPKDKLFRVLSESVMMGRPAGDLIPSGALNRHGSRRMIWREIVLGAEAFQERKDWRDRKADRRSSGGKVCSDRRTFFFWQDNIFTSLIHSAQSERASSTSDFCR